MLVLLGLAGPSSQAQDPPSAITAFFNAIKANDTNGVAQMLASNTNLTRALYVGRLPLHVAASQGHGEIVALLLKYGADINAPSDTLDTSNNQLTALDAAIWYNHPAICRQLLQAGANPNVLSPWEGSALHFAFKWGAVSSALRPVRRRRRERQGLPGGTLGSHSRPAGEERRALRCPGRDRPG
jgi:hypothetical protein